VAETRCAARKHQAERHGAISISRPLQHAGYNLRRGTRDSACAEYQPHVHVSSRCRYLEHPTACARCGRSAGEQVRHVRVLQRHNKTVAATNQSTGAHYEH
jgi:hypothetical protein